MSTEANNSTATTATTTLGSGITATPTFSNSTGMGAGQPAPRPIGGSVETFPEPESTEFDVDGSQIPLVAATREDDDVDETGQAAASTDSSEDAPVDESTEATALTDAAVAAIPADLLAHVTKGAKPADHADLAKITASLLARYKGENIPAAVLKQLAHQELTIQRAANPVAADETSANLDEDLDLLTEYEQELQQQQQPQAKKPAGAKVAVMPGAGKTPAAAVTNIADLPEEEAHRVIFGRGEIPDDPDGLIAYQNTLVEKISAGEAKPADWTNFQQKVTMRYLASPEGKRVVEGMLTEMFDAAGIDVDVLRQTSRRAIETNANRQAIADLKKVSVNGRQPFAKLDAIFVVDSAKPEIELDGGTIPNTPLNQILLKHRNTIEAVKQSGRNPAESQRLTQTARLRLAYQLWHQEQKQAATKAAETVTMAKNAEKIVADRATLQTKRGLNASTTAAANSGGTGQLPTSYAKQISKNRGRSFSDL